jgi:hypothetical protein
MWFDRVDPRDPLQITDGVYGLLARYYFKNNANLWLWGLHGNDKTKGWEYFASDKEKPELGGRYQFPLPKGEGGICFHSRTADLNSFFPDTILNESRTFTQNKYGLDGKWDIGIGLWFEYVLKENKITRQPRPYHHEQALNVGIDYTFGLGNGLGAITEFFYMGQSDKLFGNDTHVEFSVLSLDYPISLIDKVSTIIYYNWEDNHWYRFINFQRSYDYWSFYLLAFWNPEEFELFNVRSEQNIFSGKGFQFMTVYNF